MVYLVVRMKGTVNIPNWANVTLENLHLNKKFRATLIPENDQTLGMLRKIKEIVAWTSVEENFIENLSNKKVVHPHLNCYPPRDRRNLEKHPILTLTRLSLMSPRMKHIFLN